MPMHNPPHPGEIVKWECLEPLGLSITKAADGLGVPYQTLSDLVNENASVSADMAVRLSKRVWLYTRNVAEDADGV